jgi:hypothetical protein
MSSLVASARALFSERAHEDADARDLRRGVDRVLLQTFWCPSPPTAPAPVLPIVRVRAPEQPR